MAQYSSSLKEAVAFLASLGKQLTEGSQYPFESKYRALPNITADTPWNEIVGYAVDVTAADLFVTSNPTVVKKYTLQTLTAIPGSNNQAWYIDDAGSFIKGWISPSDIPDSTTNEPSYGYQANLFTSTNTLIAPTQGKWNIFYSQGIVLFESGFTPIDMGWGIPKITSYVYIGARGVGAASVIDDSSTSVSKAWSASKVNSLVASRKSYYSVNSNIPSTTTLNVITVPPSLTFTGDVPVIGNLLSDFNRKGLKIFRNGIELVKGTEVVYVNPSSIYFNFSLTANEVLQIDS